MPRKRNRFENCIGTEDNPKIIKTKIPKLPTEMIIEIISKLNEIKDLRNCMMLCKQIRDLMFKTQKIMKNIKIIIENFDDGEIDVELFQFLNDRGKFIKYLSLSTNHEDVEFVPYVLNQLPNLEWLRLESSFYYYDDEDQEVIEYFFSLPKLKHLIISSKEIENFISNAIDLRNLEKLEILQILRNLEALIDFLCQIETLKEFSVKSDSYNFKITRDISKEVKFKLNFLNFYNNSQTVYENFHNFVDCQADNLLELNISGKLETTTITLVFSKCKKLQKLIVDGSSSFIFKSSRHLGILENCKYFEVTNKFGSQLNFIPKSLPNLKILKCTRMCHVDAILNNLESLEIFELQCKKLQHLKLPNLKKLVTQTVKIKNWEKFVQNVPNLESLTIEEFKNEDQIAVILKSLEKLKKLKQFKLNYWIN